MNKIKLIIKEINESDIDCLYKIGLQEFEGERWYTKKFLLDTINSSGYYFGAFDQKMVGGILAKKIDSPKLWIFFFVVDKKFRRKGIGTKLLEKIESKCSKEYPILFVDISDKDVSAKNFYSKNKFERQAKIKDWFDIGEEAVIYSKKVFQPQLF